MPLSSILAISRWWKDIWKSNMQGVRFTVLKILYDDQNKTNHQKQYIKKALYGHFLSPVWQQVRFHVAFGLIRFTEKWRCFEWMVSGKFLFQIFSHSMSYAELSSPIRLFDRYMKIRTLGKDAVTKLQMTSEQMTQPYFQTEILWQSPWPKCGIFFCRPIRVPLE